MDWSYAEARIGGSRVRTQNADTQVSYAETFFLVWRSSFSCRQLLSRRFCQGRGGGGVEGEEVGGES